MEKNEDGNRLILRRLCIDPGLTHLACAIFDYDEERHGVVVIWDFMYACGKDPEKMAECVQQMASAAKRLGVSEALIECLFLYFFF